MLWIHIIVPYACFAQHKQLINVQKEAKNDTIPTPCKGACDEGTPVM